MQGQLRLIWYVEIRGLHRALSTQRTPEKSGHTRKEWPRYGLGTCIQARRLEVKQASPAARSPPVLVRAMPKQSELAGGRIEGLGDKGIDTYLPDKCRLSLQKVGTNAPPSASHR